MKLKFIAAGVLCALALPFTAYAQDTGQINADNVNIRDAGTTQSKVVFPLSSGAIVDIIAKEGDFYRISTSGTSDLYVSAQYLNVLTTDGVVISDNTPVYSKPDGSAVAKTASVGDMLTIKGTYDNYYVVDNNGLYAFVDKANIIASDYADSIRTFTLSDLSPVIPAANATGPIVTYAVVLSSDGLNLRSQPDASSDVLTTLPYGANADVTSTNDSWTEVTYDGMDGFLSTDYLQVITGPKPQEITLPNGSRADEIIAYAKKFLGTPYSWAGTDLNRGVDCSGFVYSVMKHFGITLNRSSYDMASNGTPVKKADLQPGDLVFFDTSGVNNGHISHVGMYIGNGQFIESSSSKKTWGVTISSLNSDYYQRTYVTARRVIN